MMDRSGNNTQRCTVASTPWLMRVHYDAGDIEIIIFFYRRRDYALLLPVNIRLINMQ